MQTRLLAFWYTLGSNPPPPTPAKNLNFSYGATPCVFVNEYQLPITCDNLNLSTLKGHCHGIWQLYKKLGV